MVMGCWHHTQSSSWRTIPCHFFAAAYSVYSHLPTWSLYFHPQPKDAPCCGDKGTHLTWIMVKMEVKMYVTNLANFIYTIVQCLYMFYYSLCQ
jgi:hypothetical protein